MKKTVQVVVSILFVFVLSVGAWAFGPGMGTGPHAGHGANLKAFPQGSQLTQEQIEKFNKFKLDTLPLRQKMMQLKTELSVLYSKKPVDYKAVALKENEIVDVRLEIHKKAVETGVADFLPMRYGMRQGRGMGGCMMDGFGPGPIGFKKGYWGLTPMKNL